MNLWWEDGTLLTLARARSSRPDTRSDLRIWRTKTADPSGWSSPQRVPADALIRGGDHVVQRVGGTMGRCRGTGRAACRRCRTPTTRGSPTTCGCATSSLRRHLESEHGLFIAEGEKVIRRARGGRLPAAVVPAGRALAARAGRRSPALAGGARLRRDRGPGRGGDRLPRAPRRPGLAAPRGPAHRRRPADRSRAAGGDRGRRRPHQRRRRPAQRRRASAGTGRCWRPGRPTRCTVGRSR